MSKVADSGLSICYYFCFVVKKQSLLLHFIHKKYQHGMIHGYACASQLSQAF